jgi:two-component system cell cycle response regulator
MQADADVVAMRPVEDDADTALILRLDPLPACRVLVVDDDELVRDHLVELLKHGGYDVTCAGSGGEALRTLDSTHCQVVLTDWKMPEMDGLALCRTLRMRDNERYVYILMLTVCGNRADIVRGLAAGADDYIVKGASTEELLARVDVGRRITRLEYSLRASNRENRRLSVTDPLTGARNRRYLTKYLPREFERCRRYDHSIAVLSCDIDGFKQINDTYGHEAGDEVLQAFVNRAMSCLRESTDWIARVGGEEFMVVLPETTLNGASNVAAKLRHVLSSQPISTCSGPLIVTVSIGVSALENAEELASVPVVELLRAADRCLYLSKAHGRDRATAASSANGVAVMSRVGAGAKHEIN